MNKGLATRCFFAYPSKPDSLSETIEIAIDDITGSGVCDALGWRDLHVSGRLVISTILDEIEESDVFVCDLTHLNPNVLFELGYAVARNKRIWIILDPSYPKAVENYQQMKILTTVGYFPYHYSGEILEGFFEEQPYLDLENTLYGDVIESFTSPIDPHRGLLYLKNVVNTDSSSALTRRLDKSKMEVITDDPNEVSIQTLAWYSENAFDAHAVISHLLDQERGESFPFQNAKYSFVSGLAKGFGKPVLMLAHSPYKPPFDYRDILKVHSTAEECIECVDGWLGEIESTYEQKTKKIIKHEKDIEAAGVLQRIHLGDHIAENEQYYLLDYFIVTSAYQEALQTNQSMIFVGRKGSGKTANLFKLSDELRKDKRNHVSNIRPVDYDIEGILDVLRICQGSAEKGFLMESLWKFLIYTELAVELFESIKNKPGHIPLDDTEEEFVNFIEGRKDLIVPEFSLRLENAIRRLCEIDLTQKSKEFRSKVSEQLHKRLLADLREYLGLLLEGKSRVCILVDNLDKAWRRREDLDILSEFLFGLLSVSKTIEAEFQKSGITWREVNLALVVFLRSDIFSYLTSYAREVDKLTYSRIFWEDVELLKRVIEERFLASFKKAYTPDEIWNRFFTDEIKEVATSKYITTRIIPRPRDIIYLCKASLAHAINHKHTRIEEEDVLQAEEEYSHNAYSTLISELKPVVENFEVFIVEFAGVNEIVTREDIRGLYNKANIMDVDLDDVIDLLIDSLFLGIETKRNEFKFLYTHDKKDIFLSLARKTAQRLGKERYKINVPFHSYLEIVSN